MAVKATDVKEESVPESVSSDSDELSVVNAERDKRGLYRGL